VAEWKVYVDLIRAQIHMDTNTPDTSDESFSSNSSGVAILYKLWGSDQERAIQESLYTRGLMRRLRILGNYLEVTGQIAHAEDVENYQIIYTPNLPKDDQGTLQNAQILASLGTESSQTIREVVEKYTGISPETEQQRVEDENKQEVDNDPMQKVFNRVQTPNPINNIDSSNPDQSNTGQSNTDQSKLNQANSSSTILDKIKGLFGGGK